MSNGTVASIHRGLAFGFLALSIVMFFLAGLASFGESFGPHQDLGRALMVLALILVILAAAGRREALVASGVLLGLMVLQSGLAALGEEVSAVFGALHPVNGLVIMFVAHQAARGLPLPSGGGGTARRSTAV